MRVWWYAVRVLKLAAALALGAVPPRPARPAPCTTNPLCYCRADHFACDDIPFHRFPDTEDGVWHVSVSRARLGLLAEAALDARRLRTLVLVASGLYHIEPGALQSMTSTLASLDLGYNEFTEVPIESLRELKVLNWLSLQNNYISELDPKTNWGFLTESLSSLSLSNNHLRVLSEGALSSLRMLAQLDLDGNRLCVVSTNAVPPSVALLRLSDNLLPPAPCAIAAGLPRLRHLHLRNNMLQFPFNYTCRSNHTKIDVLDLSHNELDDRFELELPSRQQLKQLILDLNDFTSIPSFVVDSYRLEKLSLSYNKVNRLSDALLHALKHNLEQFDLDHNELTSTPTVFRELTRLRHLSLAYNQLKELSDLPPHLHSLSLAGNFFVSFPSGLQTLAPRTLEYLDLSYNLISHIYAELFGQWSEALVTLSLKGNRIAQVTGAAFPATLPLRELVLSFNDLYYVEPAALANLTMLNVLELSSTLFSGEFSISSSLDKLSWLSLDNNNIHYVSSTDIQNFPSLEYLNMDFNKIIEFPNEVDSSVNYSYKLKELRLSYNYVSKINTEFLVELTELQSVDMSYNRMYNVSERSFTNLLNLVYLSLAGNIVECIAERAFHNLPKLQVLDLQENNLIEFSSEYFENVSNVDTIFSVNISQNRISTLVGSHSVLINILDLSHNLLETLSKSFFNTLGPHIRQIIISHNKLTHIDNHNFGALPHLQILNLHSNNINVVKRRAFADLPSLQILDLSHNNLAQLSVEQFHNMRHLRHLHLNANVLRSLPRDVFKNTVLEHLDLSSNHLTIFPSSALAQVGFTLRRLELANNRLEYLDSAMFNAIAFLQELNIACNALTVLSDNTFAGLSRLRRLELSYNMIKTNFKELFHNIPRLRRLSLAGASLKTVPHLPLTNLTELDLSANYISSYRETDVRRLTSVRVLSLAHNKLTSLQPAMWTTFPQLTSLDISYNPIVRISRGSFEGLNRLLHLRMDNLRKLEVIEPRAFLPLNSLRSLELESPSPMGRRDLSLAEIVESIPHIESLTVHMWEKALDMQLHGLKAVKLRTLEVKGSSVRRVSAHAFDSMGQQRTLRLRLSDSSVSALPAGLARPLARVPHLALDLSDNRLVVFSPATLYPNLTGWNRLATKLLPGGLVLSGNPLRCGCSVSWVGAWLRRWTAEAGAGSRAAREAARRSTCLADVGDRVHRLPFLALDADEAACHASALSSHAPRLYSPTLTAFSWIVLLYMLS